MASVNYLSLIFLAFTTIINITNAQRCYNAGNFTTDSTYSRNRDIVLSSLASNISENNYFLTTTVGQRENKVYGLVLCREDSTQQQCSSCVNSAIQGLKESCPYQKEAISWGSDPPCIIRYANRSFFGLLEVEPVDAGYNVNNITSNMKQFDQVWFDLMERLALRASMGTSKLKYASGEANLTVSQKIYAVMTCTPDLSQSNCNSCLQRVVSQYNDCCHGKQGGYVQNPNCIFRWDLFPFYNSIAEAPAPAPAPASESPPPPYQIIAEKHDKFDSQTVVIIVVPTIICVMLLAVSFAFLYLRMMKPKVKSNVKNVEGKSEPQCQPFNFFNVRLATNNFSENNKLGQGGFGAVYKGVLPDGQIIAVKRLSGNSKQGEVEFKNEVLFVASLQHRNLVRLLGFCLEGKERLLIYEFLPNSSLDRFIFDAEKLQVMNWNMRRKIIVGIARGVLYLHEDSQLRIVHRDLKASNILLDEDMNPKISDFGMAKLVGIDESQETASRIVGTLGYMAPEYAMRGRISVKSDVFSFGVLVLEIITGQKISSFRSGEENENLLTFAWKNWNKGTGLRLIDPTLLRSNSKGDIMKIYQIALLCVQENTANRPTMTSIMLMLDSSYVSLPTPSRPAYFLHSATKQENLSSTRHLHSPVRSINEASISELEPR